VRGGGRGDARRQERAHAHLVALRVGQHDERRCLRLADHPATGGDGGGDARLGDLGRQEEVDVEPLWQRLVRVRRLEPLKPGDKAPDFTLLDQDGNKVKLSSFKGRKVLVYFYPKETRS
jgi:hypothetical protein